MSRPGLYVHVPFCAKRCHYCDFSVARAAEPPLDAYLSAVGVDVREWGEHLDSGGPVAVDTVYVGGGTPSLLGVEGMASLVDVLRRTFSWDEVEWTAEANPNSLSEDLCMGWAELGVNRLSIGVQSFQDDALRWLGRLHDSRQARAAIRTARDAGLDVNADLIFGLPSTVRRDWRQDLEIMIDSGAHHVSAYGLTAEPRTPLGRRVGSGRVSLPGGREYAEQYIEVCEALRAAGFEHYEVSNFAKPGHVSRHNWHYWDGTEYLGVGPSAHSLVAGDRIWNVHRWDAYREAASKGMSLRAGRETPDAEQRRLEEIWLGLRTRLGIDLDTMRIQVPTGEVDRWEAEGWISARRPRLTLSPNGWLRLDEIATEIASWPVACAASHSGRLTLEE